MDSSGKCIKCDGDDNSYLHANQEGKCVIDFCEEYNEDWDALNVMTIFFRWWWKL